MKPTQFSHLIGNSLIKKCLTKLIDKEATSHSLLFTGPCGVGKSLFAIALAAQIMQKEKDGLHHLDKISRGIHPDLHFYYPEGKIALHSIQSLKKLCEEAYLPPYEAKHKFLVLHEAHRMLSFSANALLKTFEEPPAHTKIILLTHSPSQLLPTILSRCSTYFFQPIAENEIFHYLQKNFSDQSIEELKKWSKLSQGSLAKAIEFGKKGENKLRKILLDALSENALHSYGSLVQLSLQLSEEIENKKKQIEEENKNKRKKESDSFSAAQNEALAKELEGNLALESMSEMDHLFFIVLSWYRDLSLLQTSASLDLLINSDYKEELIAALQQGQTISLEKVQKAIEEARLALQRATTLSICIENLLLKLTNL